MKLSYDPRYNIAYIAFQEKPAQVETVHISDQLNVDLAPDGTVYGIELLNANEQLRMGDDAAIHITNEALGESAEIPLTL